MRFLALISIALVLTVGSVAFAQESGFPACSENEMLVLVISFLDLSILDSTPAATIDELSASAAKSIESRENWLIPLPLCAEAIDLQRQNLIIIGDLVGRAALQLARIPNVLNPYVLRLPNISKGVQTNLQALDRQGDTQAPPEDRRLAACSLPQMSTLDSLVESFNAAYMVAHDLQGADRWLAAADAILEWRIENLPALPNCLEAIETGFLLTNAATDAAALFALRLAGVAEEQNPYIAAVAEARQKLGVWRDEITLTRPENEGATLLMLGRASELPPCNSVEIAYAYSSFLDEVLSVLEISQDLESPTVMIDYADAHLALRNGSLARFPLCAELFELGWLAQQFLDANAAFVALHIFDYPVEQNPVAARMIEASEAFVAWGDEAADYLKTVDGIVGPAPDEREVAACRTGEIAYVITYLIPNFRDFVQAGLTVETTVDRALFEQSLRLRDRLWLELPRCQEALEIGLLMRKIAGDWLSMQAVHTIALKREDNRYAAEVQSDLDLFLEMRDAFNKAPGAAQPAVYYVTANPHVNIRACASTNCDIVGRARYGEGVSVIDDSNDWYEVRLDDGQTAYIAGFLLSKTPPAR